MIRDARPVKTDWEVIAIPALPQFVLRGRDRKPTRKS
jgi:hypothetical protein